MSFPRFAGRVQAVPDGALYCLAGAEAGAGAGFAGSAGAAAGLGNAFWPDGAAGVAAGAGNAFAGGRRARRWPGRTTVPQRPSTHSKIHPVRVLTRTMLPLSVEKAW